MLGPEPGFTTLRLVSRLARGCWLLHPKLLRGIAIIRLPSNLLNNPADQPSCPAASCSWGQGARAGSPSLETRGRWRSGPGWAGLGWAGPGCLIKITLLLSQPAARVRCPAAANCTHRQLHFSRTQIKINGQLLEPPKIGTFHVLREIEINFGNR